MQSIHIITIIDRSSDGGMIGNGKCVPSFLVTQILLNVK